MSENQQYVECCEHGRQQATYVCQHVAQSLTDNQPRGFWWSDDSPENPRPDAWCGECEALVNKLGAWNDESESFAGVKLICGACYDRAKELNLGKQKKWWELWK